ncbi:MAG TPA: DNA recombination protein RmuC [Elusimicrobia bacterium]|nr:DNA recombination protein RmuC [Elusimicrobiota bacterium]
MDKFFFLFSGAALGAVAAYFFARYRGASGKEVESMKARLESLNADNAKLQERSSQLGNETVKLNGELKSERGLCQQLNADYAKTRRELELLSGELDNQKREMLAQFKNIASEILEDKSRSFTDINKQKIDEILVPLKERLTNFEGEVRKLNIDGASRAADLKSELLNLKTLNQQITEDAENLTKALKGESKVQGNWGEILLDKILERSGLVEGEHYMRQEKHTREEEGEKKRYFPDVVVYLPEGRQVVVDSKVSLTAYVEYSSAKDEETAAKALKAHFLSIKSHIDELSDKDYGSMPGLKSPDQVLMYVPVEPAFYLAMKSDAELWEYALEKKVILVTNSTLLATLRLIESIWRQDKQGRNAVEIAKKAGELYDKIVSFVEVMNEIGSRLGQLNRSYDDAMKKMKDGRDNMLVKAEKIRELGAKASKELPREIKDLIEKDPA